MTSQPSESAIVIRPERASDAAAISAIVTAAFEGHPHSQGREAGIVALLRRDQAMVISLVAETESGVIGHVAFSRVLITGAPGGWYALGPLAVAPAEQRRGVGQQLVRAGLRELGSVQARGCVLLGDAGYYGRFGFQSWPGLTFEDVPREHVLGMSFGRDVPEGEITFHSAFFATGDGGPHT